MTQKRFTFDIDNENGFDEPYFCNGTDSFYVNNADEMELFIKEMNELNDENQTLKEALLFFVDVATSECSSNWKWDMENACQRLFNCSYEEAKEKYDDYDGSWWELGL